MAALKVSLKCVLAKKTEVSVSSQVRAKTRLADLHVIALAKPKTVMLERVARSADKFCSGTVRHG